MEHKAAAAREDSRAAREDPRAARASGESGAGVAGGEAKQRVVVRRRDPAAGAAGEPSARGAGFLPGLEALDDLPLELMGDEEEAESQLFSLLQRLRVAGTEAGASFGFDLCELALAMGSAQPEEEDDADAAEAEADGGDKGAAAEASQAPKRNRAAARQRARFVKALLVASLAGDDGPPNARGDDGPP